ncbi:hypothetical protein [Cerasicoccus frondis]|uniref:hypothetical protein n=1 Tax=Cerasicoccus frondis TaxID=490090 RepID=UPI0028526D72|nr:hypothetical protein [Cerasicoccus frondis]
MKSKILSINFLSLFCWGALFTLFSKADAEQTYSFRITGWNVDIPDLYYQTGSEVISTPARRRTLGKLHVYQSTSRELNLYEPTNDETKAPLIKASLNPKPQNNLILIWKNSAGNIDYTVLSDDPSSPAPGEVRFVNLAKDNLVLKCNHLDPFPLPPGKSRIVEPPKSHGVGVGVKVAQQANDNESWELALMSGIPVEPNERVTAFLADPRKLALQPELEGKPKKKNKDTLTIFLIRDRVILEH